jgi:hypothetical protein
MALSVSVLLTPRSTKANISYVPLTMTFPQANSWGIEQVFPVLVSIHIPDTVLVHDLWLWKRNGTNSTHRGNSRHRLHADMLGFPAFRKYMQLTNATSDFHLPDHLLYVESENALQNLFFHIGIVGLQPFKNRFYVISSWA